MPLVADFPPRLCGFNPSSDFWFDKVALGQVFSEYFTLQVLIPQTAPYSF
jgi:hypothetical protein